MPHIRAVVADDDDDVRTALEEVLESDPRFEVVAAVADGTALVDAVVRLHPDVVLLDVRMPAGGPTAAAAVTALAGAPAVVAVSASTDAPLVAQMIRAGAVGYLAKGRLGPSLPDLVARCLDGQVVMAVDTGHAALRLLLQPPAAVAG